MESKVKPKKNQYYIARRDNPQLNEPYYILVGELSEQEVIKRSEGCLYGTLTYIPYKTKKLYNGAIQELKVNNCNIS